MRSLLEVEPEGQLDRSKKSTCGGGSPLSAARVNLSLINEWMNERMELTATWDDSAHQKHRAECLISSSIIQWTWSVVKKKKRNTILSIKINETANGVRSKPIPGQRLRAFFLREWKTTKPEKERSRKSTEKKKKEDKLIALWCVPHGRVRAKLAARQRDDHNWRVEAPTCL